jgi:hypothetical protein
MTPSEAKAYVGLDLLRRWDLSSGEYARMFNGQHSRCAICRRSGGQMPFA